MTTKANVARVNQDLRRFVTRVVILLAVRITENIIRTTPVDTGFAKASWIPSVGAPVQSVAGSREAVNRSAQDAGVARLKTYKLGQGVIHIVNNVPYIADLNDGSSAQAPAAFVQGGIVRGIIEVQALTTGGTLGTGRQR